MLEVPGYFENGSLYFGWYLFSCIVFDAPLKSKFMIHTKFYFTSFLINKPAVSVICYLLVTFFIHVQAIFSDDSDDEAETFNLKKVEEPEKKIEVAHTALNHLIAGDFLESLGKELGLEVPPELPYSMSKPKIPAPLKESTNAIGGNTNNLPVENKSSSALNAVSGAPVDRVVPQQRGTAQESESLKKLFISGNPQSSGVKFTEVDLSGNRAGKVGQEKTKDNASAKSPSIRHRNQSSSSSSEDERSRKHSRRHHYRSSDSFSDSSSDHRDRYHSRSKGRKKGSSREKSSSSGRKHHKHKRRDSPSRSHYDTERERAERKKERRKRRD